MGLLLGETSIFESNGALCKVDVEKQRWMMDSDNAVVKLCVYITTFKGRRFKTKVPNQAFIMYL